MKTALLGLCCALSFPLLAQTPPSDPWASIRFLEGDWVGTSLGEPGRGTARRSYRFVLGHRFLHETNVSDYAPKKPDAPGETHEHWSFFSLDKQRKRLVLRQFHQEGFINQYVATPELGSARKLVFVAERFENLNEAWRARETYDLVSNDEFIETFEIAPPGKEFSVYATNAFKRAAAK